MCYIAGGSMPTLRYTCAGSEDSSPPTKHCVAAIANGLTFVGQFTAWGDGGVAFVDPHGSGVVQSAELPAELLAAHHAKSATTDGAAAASTVASHHKAQHSDEVQQLIARVADSNSQGGVTSKGSDPPLTFLRAYSVTLQQFQDIVSQENANVQVQVPLDTVQSLRRQGPGAHAVLLEGRYGAVVYLGEVQGDPLVTFTAPPSMFTAWIEAKQENPPSEDYVGVIAAGLIESGWAPEAAHAYLASKAAVARQVAATDREGAQSQWKWDE